MRELEEIRSRISEIDTEMAKLFVQRMEAVQEIAQYKLARGLAIEDKEREQHLINEKSAMVEDEGLRMLFVSFLQNTMELSKRMQYRMMYGMKVSFADDEPGASRHAAASVFNEDNIRPYPDFEKAYRAVEKGECDLAVLPLENSYYGEIGQVYDLIFSGTLFVNEVFAYEYNGSTTRYAVLSRIENEPSTGPGKKDEAFLIMFTVKDEVGGLAKAINIISAYGFNMRVMRSRPMHDLSWRYYFYAELVGDCSEKSARRIGRALNTVCPMVKIVGHFVENPDDPAVSA